MFFLTPPLDARPDDYNKGIGSQKCQKLQFFLQNWSVIGFLWIFSLTVHHKELRFLASLSVRFSIEHSIEDFHFLGCNGVLRFFRPLVAGVK